METHCLGGLLGNITCLWTELRGLIPICCQEGKPKPHPQDVQSLFLLLACVSLQKEAEHQRDADAPVARYEPTQMVQLSLSQGVMAWLRWLSPRLDLLLLAVPGLVISC